MPTTNSEDVEMSRSRDPAPELSPRNPSLAVETFPQIIFSNYLRASCPMEQSRKDKQMLSLSERAPSCLKSLKIIPSLLHLLWSEAAVTEAKKLGMVGFRDRGISSKERNNQSWSS